jgi:hypothetical protein
MFLDEIGDTDAEALALAHPGIEALIQARVSAATKALELQMRRENIGVKVAVWLPELDPNRPASYESYANPIPAHTRPNPITLFASVEMSLGSLAARRCSGCAGARVL